MPLLDGSTFACPYCRTNVKVPAEYRALFETHRAEAVTHRELELRYARVATPPARWVDALAAVLVLFGPALAALLVHRPTAIERFSEVIVPAMLPGTALWLWSATVHATIVRFRFALASLPPEGSGPPRCRQCGAPLVVVPDAIAARCAYCGTDSLIESVTTALRVFTKRLGDELRTLASAVLALRARKRLLVAGAVIAVVLLGALGFTALVGFDRSFR
ncbi:MAG: hypothetical protein ABI467_20145 [Kofleriaceae bacterium]